MIARLLKPGLLAVLCFALQGCSSAPGRPKPGPEIPRPDAVLDFPTLYQQNCAGCHGANGMDGPAYPLANPEYQALMDVTTLRQIVAQGEPGTMMPAFAISEGGTLTEAQIDALVGGMRAAWYKPGILAGQSPPLYRSSAAGNAAHGLEVYTADCASCHGAAAQPQAGKAGSVTDPAFLALASNQTLRTVTIAGRPDIGQPDWKGDLPGRASAHAEMTGEDVDDIVAWLSSLRSSANAQLPARAGSAALGNSPKAPKEEDWNER